MRPVRSRRQSHPDPTRAINWQGGSRPENTDADIGRFRRLSVACGVKRLLHPEAPRMRRRPTGIAPVDRSYCRSDPPWGSTCFGPPSITEIRRRFDRERHAGERRAEAPERDGEGREAAAGHAGKTDGGGKRPGGPHVARRRGLTGVQSGSSPKWQGPEMPETEHGNCVAGRCDERAGWWRCPGDSPPGVVASTRPCSPGAAG